MILPGNIAGLRKGSPVDYDGDDAIMAGGKDGGKLVVLYFGTGRGPHEYDCVDAGWPTLSDVRLDLTDATGRAHAVWGLAGHDDAHYIVGRGMTGGIRFTVKWYDFEAEKWDWKTYTFIDVPALGRLSYDNHTRLPDGSRWMAAEAIRLVCLHVAGVSA